jgi:hypothetical protein
MTFEAADRAALLREVVEAVEGGYGDATVFRAGVPSEGHGTGR